MDFDKKYPLPNDCINCLMLFENNIGVNDGIEVKSLRIANTPLVCLKSFPILSATPMVELILFTSMDEKSFLVIAYPCEVSIER